MSADLPVLVKMRPRGPSDSIGNKARGLLRLLERGFPIPESWVIPWRAYERYLANDVPLVEELVSALKGIIQNGQEYAVRSSANYEDDLESSFAGQFRSALRVASVESVVQAAWSIWASASAPAVEAYFKKKAGSDNGQGLRMAVIVQKMVHPVISGVAFSKNPMTGADEIVIEAVRGSGEALMQGGVTPLRWAWKWGNWIARPEDESALDSIVHQVVEGVRAISKAFGTNVDLEWVWDGKKLVWVQMREITSLTNINVYSNRMAREMLPGAIKPLVWSENIPLVNAAWIRLLEEAVGSTGLQPDDLARPFHYHAYFNMTALGRVFNLMGFPSEGLEMMTGTVPKEAGKAVFRPGWKSLRILPRFAAFLVDKWRFAGKMERFLQQAPDEFRPLMDEIQRLEEMDLKDRLEVIRRLRKHVNRTAYYNIVGPLLMSMYGQLLKAQLKRHGVEFAEFDLTEGMEEIGVLDPAVHLSRLYAMYQDLPQETQKLVQEGRLGELGASEKGRFFGAAFHEFLSTFGHLSDSGNDFSVAPWREIPDRILRLVPQQAPREEGGKRIRRRDLRVRGLAGWFLETAYRRARQFRLYRERISSYYTRVYGYFRVCYLSIGRGVAELGLVNEPEDVFYLSNTELEAMIEGKAADWQDLIRRRRMEIEASCGISLPQVIYGDQAPPAQAVGAVCMSGTPTSRGYYTGPVRVVGGIGDFYKVMDGDVLVVPFSEVSWTPLFAKAGAVVAESGGMLSHASIIAREYQIPAVVSVQGATRLGDGIRVTVDGYRGIVTIVQES